MASHPASASDVVELVKKGQERYPDIFQKLFPRNYRLPAGYPSPKLLALHGISAYIQALAGFRSMHNGSFDSLGMNSYFIAQKLAAYQVPTWFVGNELLQALLATDLPDLRLCDVKFPMPAMLFVFPKGGFVSPEGSIDMLAIAENTPEEVMKPLLDEQEYKNGSVLSSIHTVSIAENLVSYGWHQPMGEEYVHEHDPNLTPYISTPRLLSDPESPNVNISYFNTDMEFLPDDPKFMEGHRRLSIQLLLTLAARPELLEPGSVLVPDRERKGKVLRGEYSPNWLGRSYRIVYNRESSAGGKHASPKTHWRRGHWRLYEPAEGNRWKTSKKVWIEPILILADS